MIFYTQIKFSKRSKGLFMKRNLYIVLGISFIFTALGISYYLNSIYEGKSPEIIYNLDSAMNNGINNSSSSTPKETDYARDVFYNKLAPNYVKLFWGDLNSCKSELSSEVLKCQNEKGRFSCALRSCIRPFDLKVIYNIQKNCSINEDCQNKELEIFKKMHNESQLLGGKCIGKKEDIEKCHQSFSSWDCNLGFCSQGLVGYELYTKVLSSCKDNLCINNFMDSFKKIFCNSVMKNSECIPPIEFVNKNISCETKYEPLTWAPHFNTCSEYDNFSNYFKELGTCLIGKSFTSAQNCMAEYDKKVYKLIDTTPQIKP